MKTPLLVDSVGGRLALGSEVAMHKAAAKMNLKTVIQTTGRIKCGMRSGECGIVSVVASFRNSVYSVYSVVSTAFSRRSRLVLYIFAGLLVGSAGQLKAKEATGDWEKRIKESFIFPQRVVWVGTTAPAETENQALWQAISQFKEQGCETGVLAIEQFIEDYPLSPWGPSLHSNLGQYYRENGRFSLAFAHWQAAWELTRDRTDGWGKFVADYSLANYARLLARLGKREQVQSLAQQAAGRHLDGGPLEQLFRSSQERAQRIQEHPQTFAFCGPAALQQVGWVLKGVRPRPERGAEPRSPLGFSLTELTVLARTYQLDLKAVQWAPGEPLPVPCVLHWKVGHYGAVLYRRGDWYQVVDEAFEHPIWLAYQTLVEETSGYLLAPSQRVPAHWTVPPPQMTDQILGGQQGVSFTETEDEMCIKGDCPRFLPQWRVSEPFLNLWITDSPLSYQPALGPKVAAEIFYKQRDQRERNLRIFDIGSSGTTNSTWNLNWQTFMEVKDKGGAYASYEVTLHTGDGGTRFYYCSNDGNQNFSVHRRKSLILWKFIVSVIKIRFYCLSMTYKIGLRNSVTAITPMTAVLTMAAIPSWIGCPIPPMP